MFPDNYFNDCAKLENKYVNIKCELNNIEFHVNNIKNIINNYNPTVNLYVIENCLNQYKASIEKIFNQLKDNKIECEEIIDIRDKVDVEISNPIDSIITTIIMMSDDISNQALTLRSSIGLVNDKITYIKTNVKKKCINSLTKDSLNFLLIKTGKIKDQMKLAISRKNLMAIRLVSAKARSTLHQFFKVKNLSLSNISKVRSELLKYEIDLSTTIIKTPKNTELIDMHNKKVEKCKKNYSFLLDMNNILSKSINDLTEVLNLASDAMTKAVIDKTNNIQNVNHDNIINALTAAAQTEMMAIQSAHHASFMASISAAETARAEIVIAENILDGINT